MKSKLTLRIDKKVKEEAKTLARERGDSLSGMVEAYFRLLSSREEKAGDQHADKSGATGHLNKKDLDKESLDKESLGPITQRIAGGLRKSGRSNEKTDSVPSPHGHDKEEDRQAVSKAALKKHE